MADTEDSGPGDWSRQRMMVRVARMYYEQHRRQPEIAKTLHLSQTRVSRLLARAEATGIVRVTIEVPSDSTSDIEQELIDKCGLLDAVVADVTADGEPDESEILAIIGAAAAAYLNQVLLGRERMGISSWSSSLLAMVNRLPHTKGPVANSVVQVIGGVGVPAAQVEATRLTERLANLTGATPVFLPTPGLVSSEALAQAMLSEPWIKVASDSWANLTMLLAGIGSLEPSPLLKESGNGIPVSDQEELRALGAVGDICLRFFDADGAMIDSPVNRRIIGIPAELLRKVPRRIAVAGGKRKHTAIRAAVAGGWINVLVTDLRTAEALLE